MRIVLLLSLMIAAPSALRAQAPATPAPAQAGTAPRTAPAPQRRAQPAARSGVALTVTNPQGATLEGVSVEILGATDRSGMTNASGQINFPGMQAGSYRLRFSGDSVIAFEREVTLRAGQVANVDITLNAAPAPPEVPVLPEAPAAAAAAQGPIGQPQALSILDVLEKEFIGRQPRRDSVLSCSGDTRATLIQLNEPLPERLYEQADAVYYVLGGEGTIRLDGRDAKLATNGFASVPRGTSHSFERRGSRALILLAVLGGEPCEEAR